MNAGASARLSRSVGLIGLVALIGGWLAASAQAGAPETAIPVRRHYNPEYLFSIEVPPCLECEIDPAPSPNHGCQIQLDSASKAVISVIGNYNALDRSRPQDELVALMGYLLEPGVSVKMLRREPTRLGDLEAERWTLRVEEPEKARPQIQDLVVALRSVPSWGDIVYTVRLDTTEDRYPRDVVIFEAVVASWRAEELPPK